MKLKNNIPVIRQLDKKLVGFYTLQSAMQPHEGWIRLIRKTLNMSQKQLSKKLSVQPSTASEMEAREKEGTVTLKTLRDAASALDMKLVYGFIPNDGSLEKLIERKAHALAESIVKRTSASMKLEDQENSQERLKDAIRELTDDIKKELPGKLWD